jgi:enoyl-CoA hydratase
VVVLAGKGPAFCSGADFAAVSGPDAQHFLSAFERMLESVAGCRVATVASIHGAALGGGLQLASVCDFRIAATDAKLGIPSARLGIVVNFENVERLVLLVGLPLAKEILMTGRVFTGAEAEGPSLVTRAASPDDLPEETRRFAERIAALAPLSVRGAKAAIAAVEAHLAGARGTVPERVAAAEEAVVEAYASADLQEGLAAMSEKRAARFTGR